MFILKMCVCVYIYIHLYIKGARIFPNFTSHKAMDLKIHWPHHRIY